MISIFSSDTLQEKRKSAMIHTEITIKGKISSVWSDWFEQMQILPNDWGDTILTGDLPDKSAVYGVISHLSSLGITLVSVHCQEDRKFISLGPTQ
jgi:hypothetical protein